MSQHLQNWSSDNNGIYNAGLSQENYEHELQVVSWVGMSRHPFFTVFFFFWSRKWNMSVVGNGKCSNYLIVPGTLEIYMWHGDTWLFFTLISQKKNGESGIPKYRSNQIYRDSISSCHALTIRRVALPNEISLLSPVCTSTISVRYVRYLCYLLSYLSAVCCILCLCLPSAVAPVPHVCTYLLICTRAVSVGSPMSAPCQLRLSCTATIMAALCYWWFLSLAPDTWAEKNRV